MIRLLLICWSLALTGCATLNNENHADINQMDTSEAQFKDTAYSVASGMADYTFAGGPQKAEWVVCKLKSPKSAIIVMHSDRAGYDKSKFCPGWVAQSFLSKGFDVIMVNRPGYGASTGSPEFAGAQSMAAVVAGVKEGVDKGHALAPTGIWGYSSGATAAALVSRKIKGLQFALLGGGIYDLDDTLKKTADAYIKSDIETIKRTGGNAAIEDRSIAYDVSGLPKTMLIYHGKQDTSVPPSEAKAFSDALESSGDYKVKLQIIDGVSHVIPWAQHRKIVEVMAAGVGS